MGLKNQRRDKPPGWVRQLKHRSVAAQIQDQLSFVINLALSIMSEETKLIPDQVFCEIHPTSTSHSLFLLFFIFFKHLLFAMLFQISKFAYLTQANLSKFLPQLGKWGNESGPDDPRERSGTEAWELAVFQERWVKEDTIGDRHGCERLRTMAGRYSLPGKRNQ